MKLSGLPKRASTCVGNASPLRDTSVPRQQLFLSMIKDPAPDCQQTNPPRSGLKPAPFETRGTLALCGKKRSPSLRLPVVPRKRCENVRIRAEGKNRSSVGKGTPQLPTGFSKLPGKGHPSTWASMMRLPQVSSMMAWNPHSVLVGSMMKVTPSFFIRSYSLFRSSTKNEV
jgi:hypothetical protein